MRVDSLFAYGVYQIKLEKIFIATDSLTKNDDCTDCHNDNLSIYSNREHMKYTDTAGKEFAEDIQYENQILQYMH